MNVISGVTMDMSALIVRLMQFFQLGCFIMGIVALFFFFKHIRKSFWISFVRTMMMLLFCYFGFETALYAANINDTRTAYYYQNDRNALDIIGKNDYVLHTETGLIDISVPIDVHITKEEYETLQTGDFVHYSGACESLALLKQRYCMKIPVLGLAIIALFLWIVLRNKANSEDKKLQ